jgi:hypothetical protein
MGVKERIHRHIEAAADELLQFITSSEAAYPDRWVPAAHIKTKLELNFVAVPRANKVPRGEKGWLFATLARLLEDQGRLKYRKLGNRAFYRSS